MRLQNHTYSHMITAGIPTPKQPASSDLAIYISLAIEGASIGVNPEVLAKSPEYSPPPIIDATHLPIICLRYVFLGGGAGVATKKQGTGVQRIQIRNTVAYNNCRNVDRMRL